MSRQLLRITKALYNTPHVVTPDVLERIEQYLSDRNGGEFEVANINVEKTKRVRLPDASTTGMISVDGVLTYKSYFDMATCTENTSYQAITTQFDYAVAAGYKTIVLLIDSPGGEAYGAFETGRYLRSQADAKGIRLVSYVDGLAASGGYILASAAHEVIINPDAQAGSIGVVVQLTNTNKMLEQMGVERTFIYAGDNKIPFNAEGGWREEFLSDIQTKVTSLYGQFVGYVSEMMGLSEEAIVSTQAAVFLAQDAKEKGLVHKLMTREEFNSYLKEGVNKPMADNKAVQVVVDEELKAQLADLTAAMEKQKEEFAVAMAAVKAEADNLKMEGFKAKAQEWAFAGVDVDAYASSALAGSISVEMFDAAMNAAAQAIKAKDDSMTKMKAEVEGMKEVGAPDADKQVVVEDEKVKSRMAALQHVASKNKNIKVK